MNMKKHLTSEISNSKIHMSVRKNACSQNCYTSCVSFNIWKLSSNKVKFLRRCTQMLTATDPKTKFGKQWKWRNIKNLEFREGKRKMKENENESGRSHGLFSAWLNAIETLVKILLWSNKILKTQMIKFEFFHFHFYKKFSFLGLVENLVLIKITPSKNFTRWNKIFLLTIFQTVITRGIFIFCFRSLLTTPFIISEVFSWRTKWRVAR